MFSKMLTRTIIFCLLAIFFSTSSMLSTNAWEADKRCGAKKINARWDPHACGGYGESDCASNSVEFKAEPGPCIEGYYGWECDQNGPTEVYYVGTVQCYWREAKHPKTSVCTGDETTLVPEDIATCRDRKKT